jgi:predicted nucleic acid-binding protein
VPGSLAYLDSSAIVKLIAPEPETSALRGALTAHPDRISSRLAEVEVLRAVRRIRPRAMAMAERILERIGLIELDPTILAIAARLEPKDLRTLDALHLATAVAVRDETALVITYDRRVAEAAVAAGLAVASPA